LLADRFGARTVASVSLLISAPLLAFANGQIVLCCIGLFLFNVTTAVTLCVIAARLPHNPGLSFGLTTVALFAGTAISYFWAMPEGMRPLLTVVMIVVSVVCVVLTTPGKVAPGRVASGEVAPGRVASGRVASGKAVSNQTALDRTIPDKVFLARDRHKEEGL